MSKPQSTMREQLLKKAKNSFYDNGYTATTYALLAKELSVSPGSFSYHFETKAHIAKEIYVDYLNQQKDLFTNKMLNNYGYIKPILVFALIVRMNIRIFSEDKKIFRFYEEFARDDIELALETLDISFFTPYVKDNDLNNEQDEGNLIKTAIKGLSIALSLSFFSGKIKSDIDYYTEQKIKLELQLLKVPDAVIKETIAESKEMFEKMNIKILPYFKLN